MWFFLFVDMRLVYKQTEHIRFLQFIYVSGHTSKDCLSQVPRQKLAASIAIANVSPPVQWVLSFDHWRCFVSYKYKFADNKSSVQLSFILYEKKTSIHYCSADVITFHQTVLSGADLFRSSFRWIPTRQKSVGPKSRWTTVQITSPLYAFPDIFFFYCEKYLEVYSFVTASFHIIIFLSCDFIVCTKPTGAPRDSVSQHWYRFGQHGHLRKATP